MRTLSFLTICTCLFLTNSISASDKPDNGNSEQIISAQSQHHAVYWISNRSCADLDSDSYVDQVNFTVSWQYSGPSSHPGIAYIVTISSPYGTLAQFQDSAIGQVSGSKNYSIKVQSTASMGFTDSSDIYISVNGSNGEP